MGVEPLKGTPVRATYQERTVQMPSVSQKEDPDQSLPWHLHLGLTASSFVRK